MQLRDERLTGVGEPAGCREWQLLGPTRRKKGVEAIAAESTNFALQGFQAGRPETENLQPVELVN